MRRATSIVAIFAAGLSLLVAQPSASPTTSPTAAPPSSSSLPASPPAPAATAQAKPAAPKPVLVAPKASLSKDETVFAVLDATGAVKSVIVSDWIHSEKPGIEIKDKSNLTGIENVKGYEQPRRVGDALMWKLDGSDLYYRGKSTQSLPLAITIKYWLDGKPIEPKLLSGKAGTVRVRVEVKNLATAERIIDGTKRRIFAPMIVVVGLTIPVVGYRDLQVTGGTILTDGQSNIAAGLLVPGLRESILAAGSFGSQGLDLSSFGIKDMPLPEAFEFTAKADKFKLGSIYIAATPNFPEIGGPNTVKVLDDALAGFQQLADSSKAIKDGSALLAQGTAMLRAAISQALTAIRPVLEESKPTLESISSFLDDERNIAAARELLSSGDSLGNIVPMLTDIIGQAGKPENRKLITSAVAAAKDINLKDLLGIPGAASIINEESLVAVSEALVSSDDLYRGMDEKRLQAAADFAVGAGPLFDAIVNFDETSKSYDPVTAAALQALGAKAFEYEQAAQKMAKLTAFDSAKMLSGLQDRAHADITFFGATAFLDDTQAIAALASKLAANTPLSDAERSNLGRLLSAATAERAAARIPIAAQAAEALPILAEAAQLGVAAAPGAFAASAVSAKTLPGLARAQTNRTKTDQTIAAARKILDPRMVGVISSTIPKLFAVRKSFDKNKNTLQAARSFLAVRLKNGSFKNQIDSIEALQQNLKALEPFMSSVQAALSSPELSSLLGTADEYSVGPQLADLIADIEQLQPLLVMGKDFLSTESIAKLHALLLKIPELEAGISQLDDGSALLAVKMSELAAGTKQFDEQGIQLIGSQIVEKAQLVRGFLKVKDVLAALSRDYQSFSGAPEGADTTLKFIFKTDEIR